MCPWMFFFFSMFQRAGLQVAGKARSKSRKAVYVGDLLIVLLRDIAEMTVWIASEVLVFSLKPN